MIALFGGSFDPIHQGHLDLCRRICDRYQPKSLFLVPTGQNPLKSEQPHSSAEDRFRMAQLAVGASTLKQVTVVDWEVRRSGPSYTWDTVQKTRAETKDSVLLVVGDEVFHSLPHWHRCQELVQAVDVAVASRHHQVVPAHIERALTLCSIKDFVKVASTYPGEIKFSHTYSRRFVETLSLEALPLSSTEIRDILNTYRGTVRPPGLADPVWEYIKKKHLYSVK